MAAADQPHARILTPIVDLNFLRARMQDHLDRLTFEDDIYPHIFKDVKHTSSKQSCFMSRQVLPHFNNVSPMLQRAVLSLHDDPSTVPAITSEKEWLSTYTKQTQKIVLCWEFVDSLDELQFLACYPSEPSRSDLDHFKTVSALLESRQLLLFVIYNQHHFIDRLLPNLFQKQQPLLRTYASQLYSGKGYQCKSQPLLSFDLEEIEPVKLYPHSRLALYCRRLSDYKVASLGLFDHHHVWSHEASFSTQWSKYFPDAKQDVLFHILFPHQWKQNFQLVLQNHENGYCVVLEQVSWKLGLAVFVPDSSFKLFTFFLKVSTLERIKSIHVEYSFEK